MDAGASWTPVTDDQDSLHIGALAIDPGNPAVVYAGLGEANSAGETAAYFGLGILKTTDAGDSWTLLSHPAISHSHIARIAVDPTNSDAVFAATNGGVARSNDGGATWTTVDLGGPITDVVIDAATTPHTVLAAVSAVGVFGTTIDKPHVAANWTPLPGTDHTATGDPNCCLFYPAVV